MCRLSWILSANTTKASCAPRRAKRMGLHHQRRLHTRARGPQCGRIEQKWLVTTDWYPGNPPTAEQSELLTRTANGKGFVARANERVIAFLEVESAASNDQLIESVAACGDGRFCFCSSGSAKREGTFATRACDCRNRKEETNQSARSLWGATLMWAPITRPFIDFALPQ
jgi:hypothetical protein